MKRDLFALLIILIFIPFQNLSAQTWKQLNDSLNHYYNKGNYTKAIYFGEEGLIQAKNEFGKESNNSATSLNNLAFLYRKSGNYSKAEILYMESLQIRKKILGEEHPDYYRSLYNLADLYDIMGNYVKAEPLFLDALSIRKKVFGDQHPLYANSLTNLAVLYDNMRNYSKAEPLYEEALSIRKRVFGIEHADYASSLNNLAILYEKMHNYAKAEPLYVEALSIRKKVLGEEHLDYAKSLNNLADLYESMGSYNKAEPLYIESLQIRKRILGKEHPDYAKSLNNLAYLYKSMGRYVSAESLYMEALAIWEKISGGDNTEYTSGLNNLASLYESMGRYAKAEPFYLKALQIRKKILGEEHPDYAISLNNLAYLYGNLGNYAKAEPLYLESLQIRKKILGEEHPDYATSLNNLAILYGSMGSYDKAESLCLATMKIYKRVMGENHPAYATSLYNLAHVYHDMGDFTKAEPFYLKALQIQKKILGEEHPDYATSLNNLAGLYVRTDNYDKAEPFYIEALRIRKKILGEEHPAYATSLHNLAYLYGKLGNYAKAEPLYLESLQIRKNILGEKHSDYATCLNNLAGLYRSTGRYDKAELFLIKGIEIETNHILSNFTNLSEKEKTTWVSINGYLNNHLLSLQKYHKGISGSTINFILNQQLLFKSLVLSDTKDLLQIIQNSKDSVLLRTYSDWSALKNNLSQQYSLPIVYRNISIGSWEKKTEDLEKELNRKSSTFRDQQQSLRFKTSDVQKGLTVDEVSVEFVRFRLFNERWTDSIMYAAYILFKNDSIPVYLPLCEEKQLQKLFDSAGSTATSLVNKFYRGTELKNKSTATALGKELYKLIWAPLEPFLKGIKKISYSPAGKLYSIAFHALPADSTTMLMDKYELNQYTSSRQIALRKKESQRERIKGITLFGDAAFTLDSTAIEKAKNISEHQGTNIYTPPNRGNRGGAWASLSGTAEEIKKIKLLFEQNSISTKSFTQTTATEENLKSLSGNSPEVLHIATHGFFLPEPDKKGNDKSGNNENTYSLADDPLLRSGLILSGGNYAWSGKNPIEGMEDGIATAYEISQLNLSNTELVVLSACETALGDIKGSEGVFGLQRAFKMAGVKKMIVSLWQVPDKETAELMTAFYGYWLKGKTINEAFAQAQAEMRKKYSPYYWAAFVLVE